MPKPPRGYRREVREVFVKKNADFSDSQKHSGLKSGLARDRNTNDLSHSLIGERVEQDSRPSQVVYVNNVVEERSAAVDESAPDIAKLVPIALVAVAGIAAGVAGAKIAQSRKRRRQEEQVSLAAGGTPAGWYQVGNDPTQLRYWNGVAWTLEYAQRATAAPSIVADWYPDPSNAAQLRYWDGASWTHHVSPSPGAAVTPADWYPDPSNPGQLRYWDGVAWTAHVSGGPGVAAEVQSASESMAVGGIEPRHERPRIEMTTAEWRAHVEAWARAGAIQQELWSRLTNARITDADDMALAAQHQWEALTPQDGARRIQLMLEANPSLRGQGVLEEFVRLFGAGQPAPHRIESNR